MKTIEIPSQLTKPYDRALSFLVQLEQEARGDGAGVNHKGQTVATAQFRNAIVTAIISKPNSRTGARVTRWQLGFTSKTIKYGELLAHLRDREAEAQAFEAIEARRVPLVAEVLYIDSPKGDTPTVGLKGKRDLALKGTYHRFGVGAIPRGQKGRQEYQGELVEGPWAYAFGLASCLTNSKAHQDADAARRAQDIEVENGSELLIDGVWYTVRVERGEFIKLDPKA